MSAKGVRQSETRGRAAYLLGLASSENVDGMEHRDLILGDVLDEANGLLRDGGEVLLRVPADGHAIVARLVAVLGIERLVEVAEHLLPAAVGQVETELDDSADVVLVVLLLGGFGVAVVDETVEELRVGVGEEEEAGRALSVATRSAGFLQMSESATTTLRTKKQTRGPGSNLPDFGASCSGSRSERPAYRCPSRT